LERILPEKNKILEQVYGEKPFDLDALWREQAEYGKQLKNAVVNGVHFLRKLTFENKRLLFEGAQGAHLDLDLGTYPFVTSSNTCLGAIGTGCGFSPRKIDEVIGIVKAYTTRVGHGPFPCELLDNIGDTIQRKGAEFGATTGRRRRCGWLDTVLVRNAVRLNGLSGIGITKLDVLGGLASLKICTSYDYHGEILHDFPANLKILAECQPIYETLPGWSEEISHIRKFEDLPVNTRNYLKRAAELVETPLDIISVGPGREEIHDVQARDAGMDAPQDRPGRAADLRGFREHDMRSRVVIDRAQVLVIVERERHAFESHVLDGPSCEWITEGPRRRARQLLRSSLQVVR